MMKLIMSVRDGDCDDGTVDTSGGRGGIVCVVWIYYKSTHVRGFNLGIFASPRGTSSSDGTTPVAGFAMHAINTDTVIIVERTIVEEREGRAGEESGRRNPFLSLRIADVCGAGVRREKKTGACLALSILSFIG